MASYRKVRIETELLKQLSMLILKGKIKDPLISDTFITVTHVDLANDLSTAKVYVSFLGSMIGTEDSDPAETEKLHHKALAGLRRATGYIQHELGQSIRIRRIPELKFVLDETIKEGDMMVETIDNLKTDEEIGLTEQNEDPAPSPSDP